MTAGDRAAAESLCVKARKEMLGPNGDGEVPEDGFVGKYGFTAYTPTQLRNVVAVSNGRTLEQILAQCRAHEGRIAGGKQNDANPRREQRAKEDELS